MASFVLQGGIQQNLFTLELGGGRERDLMHMSVSINMVTVKSNQIGFSLLSNMSKSQDKNTLRTAGKETQ